MNHATLLILLIFFTLTPDKYFKDDYKWAVNFLCENKATINSLINKDERAEILSVGFPELIRYSRFMDFFETKALELLYVQKGAESADFSIGTFQIKPSFVEQLENYVQTHNSLAHLKTHTFYSTKNTAQIRQQRVERLKTLNWQLRYLSIFRQVVYDKFPEIRQLNPVERISFLATAYNHGFQCNKEEIKRWENIKTFPFGTKTTNNPFSFSEVSVYFYKNHYTKTI